MSGLQIEFVMYRGEGENEKEFNCTAWLYKGSAGSRDEASSEPEATDFEVYLDGTQLSEAAWKMYNITEKLLVTEAFEAAADQSY